MFLMLVGFIDGRFDFRSNPNVRCSSANGRTVSRESKAKFLFYLT